MKNSLHLAAVSLFQAWKASNDKILFELALQYAKMSELWAVCIKRKLGVGLWKNNMIKRMEGNIKLTGAEVEVCVQLILPNVKY